MSKLLIGLNIFVWMVLALGSILHVIDKYDLPIYREEGIVVEKFIDKNDHDWEIEVRIDNETAIGRVSRSIFESMFYGDKVLVKYSKGRISGKIYIIKIGKISDSS